MTNRHLRKKQGGYSLLEMAIALMIIGLLIAPIFALYQKYLVIQAQETTQRNITTVIEAINAHRFAYGQFPCPAMIDVGRGDPGYGISTDCSDVSVGVGTFANGYSIFNPGQRDGGTNIFDSNGIDVTANNVADPGGLDDTIRVRRGAIPFVELGLSEGTALDGHGNKIVYAVTELLADPVFMAAYNTGTGLDPSYLGGINVIDENDRSLIFDQDTAGTTTPLTQYVVFSHGSDAQGAFRQDGIQVSPCPAGEDQTQNCGLTLAEATFRNTQVNTSGGAAQNDDIVRYYNRSQNIDAWMLSAANSADIHLKPQVPAGQQFLDVGTVGVPDGVSNVDGTILAEDIGGDAIIEGQFISDQVGNNICNGLGGDCVNLNALMQPTLADAQAASGVGESILCDDPTRPYMTGIANNDERCTDAFEVTCPAGSFILGFDGNGRPICDQVPCRATTVSVCGVDDVVVPEQDQGTSFWTPVRGDSRQVRYRCNADAEWELDASISANDDVFDDGNNSDGVRGVCTCNPVDFTTSVGCPNTTNNQYTNNGATRRTRTNDNALCSRTITDDIATMCECLPHTVTQTPRCSLGGGRYERERERGCNPNPYWATTWTTTDVSGCGCATTSSSTTTCLPYETGPGITQAYTVDCVTGVRTADGAPTGSCSCNDSATKEVVEPCPVGEIGTGPKPGVVYSEEYDCASSGWDRDPVPKENNCVPIPPGTFIWVTSGSQVSVASRAGRPVAGDDCVTEGANDVCMISGSGFAARACRCRPNPD